MQEPQHRRALHAAASELQADQNISSVFGWGGEVAENKTFATWKQLDAVFVEPLLDL